MSPIQDVTSTSAESWTTGADSRLLRRGSFILVADRKLAGPVDNAITVAPETSAVSGKLGNAGARTTPLVHRPVVRPSPVRATRSFLASATWEGSVVECFSTYFAAEVLSLQTGEAAYVEFANEELAASDVPLCEPGALFYWAVGYETLSNGQRNRVSTLAFRRVGSAVASKQ